VRVHVDQARRDQLAARVEDLFGRLAGMFAATAAILPPAMATSIGPLIF
jgi:hypothetical protein